MTESTYDRGERPCIACKAGAGVSDALYCLAGPLTDSTSCIMR